MSNTRIQIQTTLEELVSLRKVKMHLAGLKEELGDSESNLQKLEKQLEKHSKGVKDLENTTIRSLFTKVLGNKEEQLEEERQAYLAELLKFKEKRKEVELLQYEVDLLAKKTANLPGLEKQLEVLKNKREDEILRTGEITAQKLRVIAQKSDSMVAHQRELLEAFNVGEQLKSCLAVMINHLKQAKNWGNWDMAGKGRYADYNKKRAIDQAFANLHKAQQLINMYKRELNDIGIQADLPLKFESFNSFLDFFFDNLISDWIVQRKIKATLDNIHYVADVAVEINSDLQNDLTGLKEEIIQLERDRDHILENN